MRRVAPADRRGGLSRRRLLAYGAFGLASVATPRLVRALALPEADRRLSLYNLHTGERVAVTYWMDGDYVSAALAEVDRLLRDHRTGEVGPIDPGVLERLRRVRQRLGSSECFHVVSGFRSASTNAMLRDRGGAVASRSLHLAGKAVDVFLPGRSVAELRAAALAESGGGVGGYPDMVHLDVGRFRTW